MDKASFKMLEGKKYKAQFEASQAALNACDSIKLTFYQKETVYKATLSDLKTVNSNMVSTVTDYKIIVKNEKKKNLRNTIIAFLAGSLTGGAVAFFVFR